MLKVKFFKNIVVRSNNFGIENYESNYKNVFNFYKTDELFRLSILLASYDFYNNFKEDNKTERTLFSYFKRAHFNPVPFGTFSSVGIVPYDSEKTTISKMTGLDTVSSFDNFFLNKLSFQELLKTLDEHICFPNPSIRLIENKRIGFERTLIKNNGHFETDYIELDFDDDIGSILEKFSSGSTINHVCLEIHRANDYAIEEIKSYLVQLFEIGMIISDKFLFPYNKETSATHFGSDFINDFSRNIINDNQNITPIIESIENDYHRFKDDYGTYTKLFSTTSFSSFDGAINQQIQKSISKYIQFCLEYNGGNTPINEKLKKFGSKYYHTFCDGLTPLNKVFSSNHGITYDEIDGKPSRVSKDLLSQLCSQTNGDIILNLDGNKNKFSCPPDLKTFGVIYELLECQSTNNQICYMKSMGGATGINMLTRFNTVTENLCNEIAHYEKLNYEDRVLAEINFISQSRATNILARRKYYDYDISVNTVPVDENSIELKDLHLHFDGNNFHLVSKKLNKEVIPRLTSAIDYSKTDNLAYEFLCDLQYQNAEIYSPSLNLNNHINTLIPYAPRIFLDHKTLLFPAQFLLTVADYENFADFKSGLHIKMEEYGIQRNLVIQNTKGDLVIETTSENDLNILYKSLLKQKVLYASELIYNSYKPVIENQKNERVAHECLTIVKNTAFLPTKRMQINNLMFDKDYPPNTSLISGWLCLELYCKTSAENDVISTFSQIAKRLDFFFIRYNYPNNHIRIRFKISPQDSKNYHKIMYLVESLVKSSLIRTYKIVPYMQELTRYGGKKLLNLTEILFMADSKAYIYQFLNEEEHGELLLGINRLLFYLELFELTIEDKIELCEYNISSFFAEFNFDSSKKKKVNMEVREMQNSFQFIEQPLDFYENIIPKIKAEISNFNKSKKYYYISNLIHMSLNRLFTKKQRLFEFKSYLNSSSYLKKKKHLTP